jgi:hypothetical protein
MLTSKATLAAAAALVAVCVSAAPTATAQPYRSCDDAWAAGEGILLQGEPGYSVALDPDMDGLACVFSSGVAVSVPDGHDDLEGLCSNAAWREAVESVGDRQCGANWP